MHWAAHIGISTSLLYFSAVRVWVGVSLMYGLTILIAIPIHMTECLLSMWTSQGVLSHSFSVQTCSSRHLGLSQGCQTPFLSFATYSLHDETGVLTAENRKVS